MTNEFAHSAEGTHWTKKNHKYIRKEGNRYIYPTDGNKLRRNTSMYNQNSPDYRAISTANRQRVNRENAANGANSRNQEFAKRMTQATHAPTATINGNKIKFGPSMDTMNRRTVRQKMQGSTNYKALSQQNVNKTNQKSAVSNQAGVNKDFVKAQNVNQKRKHALNNQGATLYDGRSRNKNNGYEYAKRENNWNQERPGTISARRKKAMYQQGSRDVPSYGITMNTLGSADRARKANWFRPHFGNSDLRTLQKDVNTRDYSKSVTANRGKTFVNSLKEKFGPMNKKKDQLVKKAKDFFNRIKARNTEKKILNEMYDERSGRPKSYTTHDSYGNYVKGQDPNTLLGPTTGNAGSSNLRKGVEAGRKRAGIKNSPQVHGVENNLSNRGYETTNYDNDHDTYRGLHNVRNSFGPEAIDSQRWKDMVTSKSKQKDEEYRKRIDESRSRATGKPDELTRGTKAGQKRVNRKKLRERYGH